jgi:anti-anti-sigma factor
MENELIVKMRQIPQVTILDLQGSITGSAEDPLMDAYHKACDAGAERILLDMTHAQYMNSSGLSRLPKVP